MQSLPKTFEDLRTAIQISEDEISYDKVKSWVIEKAMRTKRYYIPEDELWT